MSICVFVCLCVDMFVGVYVWVYIFVYVCVRMCMCLCRSVYVCVRACMCTLVCICMYTSVWECVCVCVCIQWLMPTVKVSHLNWFSWMLSELHFLKKREPSGIHPVLGWVRAGVERLPTEAGTEPSTATDLVNHESAQPWVPLPKPTRATCMVWLVCLGLQK